MMKSLAAAALTFVLSTAAQAQDTKPRIFDFDTCKEDPRTCNEWGRKDFCKDYPVTCELRDQRRRAFEDFCATNWDKCDALRKERKAIREERREYCRKNPKDCEGRKGEFGERLKERREQRDQ